MYSAKKSRPRAPRLALLTALIFLINTASNAVAPPTASCITSSASWVNSALPQVETGTFRLTFDATPEGTGIDGLIGLSSGPAAAYTSLAAIVRFNSTGTIDARNGANYAAATAIPYSAGTTYHFILDVNVTAGTYNAYVVVNGTQLVIGSRFAFRSEQAAVSSLNNLAFFTSAGTESVCNITVGAVPPPCVASSASWLNSTLPQMETGIFRVTFDATPSGTAIDGVIGLSSGPAAAYTSLAAIVRFNSAGTIDAMNGNAYRAATTIPYSVGVTYHFILDVNVPAHTYNAHVVVGGTEILIGSQFAFRSQQGAVSSLNNMGSFTSAESLAICNVALSAAPPTITTQPVSQIVIAGQSATFSVAVTGTAPLSYQWQKNGAAISGATSATYQTPATVPSDNGSQFSVVVSNGAGNATSNSASLTVNVPLMPPTITTEPVSQTVILGQTAVFSVAATGTAPISYQWRKNGVAITGATSSIYQTAATVVSDNGAQFTVVVSNSAGSVTSNSSTLTVNAPPAITTQPLSQSVTTGQIATFSVAVTGTIPMSYQWQKNGAAISGATLSTYQTPATTISDNGSQFTVVASNAAGSATSSPAILTVAPLPCVNSSASWLNSALPQVETGTFRIAFDATPAGSGIDGVIGPSSGPASDYTYLAAILRFNSTGTIDARNAANYSAATTIPYSAGTTYHFILDVNVAAHTYSAYVVVGGTQIVIGSQFAFRSEQAAVSSLNNMGSFTSVESLAICNIALSAAPPAITTQPVSQTVIAGQTASFSVEASGTAPLTYQWQKNGATISGATSATYQTPVATTADNGSQFSVIVSNAAGNVTSSSATLSVGAITLLLSPSATQLSFGSVTVSSSSTQNVTLTNIGNANVTISNLSIAGAGFAAGGGVTGLILSPGQAATVSVRFAPAAAGSATGTVTVTSNASNSPSTIALTGTGAQQHSVLLNWIASTSSVVGYNIYSSQVSGGPYVKLNSSPIAATTYTDSTVQSGQSYYYVATAVSSGNIESSYSTQASAVIP